MNRLATALCFAILLMVGCLGRSPTPLTFGIDAEAHANFFPIATGEPHALEGASASGAISCASCHVGAASFREFSCVSCHEHRADGTDPDGSTGMNQVHTEVPGFRYDSANCLACHPGGLGAELGRQDHTPFFPIAAGTPHASTTCAGCHVEPSSRAVVTCTSCHQDSDGDGQGEHDVSPMAAAHGDDMVALGYTWDTNSCRSCHAAAEVPGRLDTHEGAFPIAAPAVHASVSCVDCHASREDRSQLSCITCHDQVDDGAGSSDVHGESRMLAVHDDGGVPGYVFESNACYACHTDAQVPGALDHERYLPIGVGSIHEVGASIDTPAVLVSCATCHQDPQAQRNVTCTDCHAHAEEVLAPTHAAFPDYQYESSNCVFCHLGGAKKLEHPFFPVESSTVHALDNVDTAAVDGLRCAECHASATQRTQLNCTSCHEHTSTIEAENHGTSMARFGYRFESAACFSCHRTAQVPGTFDHEPLFPLRAPSGNGAHQPLACADCHTNRDNRAASLSCTTCHQPTSGVDAREVHAQPRLAEVHGALPGYAFTPTVCIECHTDGTAATAAENLPHDAFPIAAGQTHAISSAGGQIDCQDCHSVDGDYTLATLDCRSCHLQKNDNDGAGARDVHGEPRLADRHVGVGDYAFATPSCLECHPNGQAAANIAHNEFPIDGGTVHASIGCNECHGSANRSDLNALQCAQCHNQAVNLNPTVNQLHTGIPDFGTSSPNCYRCHPNADPVGPMDHTGYFPIDTGSAHASSAYRAKIAANQTSCSACHASRTNRADTRCSACHAGVPPSLTTSHTQVRGVVTTSSTGCKECHADSQVDRLNTHSAFSPRHEGARCAQCHKTLRSDKPFGRDFNRYTCTGCHHNDPACTATNQRPCGD